MGARPHSGSVHCARCQRWGHHSDQCRAKCARCPLCSGPIQRPIISSASTLNASTYANAQTVCPFWKNRFDRAWLKRQFPARST
ncbi:hypothetical protein AGABI1DRAFT_134921 [Agaricus bisporus var. burnettii JB137-S8]|uniref:Uncharacterized protein n=1 Tax=Agaricus bisporus var. burnettii (strain JB137-S8 / ATCC MYA-4627 / FGSC 10392) TaxID=597362 RepID=K5XG54_AGABU|nr:uncharacterized protein AGABI1DRAFT_134921 [Agaricus bisporus var. burnettii JB137-S8]EKM73370.1 hypothetical protein AGABI1DRAFT_134921 [Agaricus bisporus var. burnettii JB137-S8]